MLGKEIAGSFGGRVDFVYENFGESELADRFGIERYPAVFIDDVLVAKPKDFGFYGSGGSQGRGRYVPWKDASNHEKFTTDLRRMIETALSGDSQGLREQGTEADSELERLVAMPQFELTDLAGNPLTPDELKDKVVIVEFWASWCPPCLGTLDWLAELSKTHGDDVVVLAIAVESPEDPVRQIAVRAQGMIRWAMGTPAVAAAFGDVVAVPTMFIFDRSGKTVSTYYGAPPGLHERASKVVSSLISP